MAARDFANVLHHSSHNVRHRTKKDTDSKSTDATFIASSGHSSLLELTKSIASQALNSVQFGPLNAY